MRLGASWIDDVSQVIASIIPKYANIDLGSEQNQFRNLYLSGTLFTSGSQDITGNLSLTGTLGVSGATALASTLTVTGALTGSSTVTGTAFNLADGSDKNHRVSTFASGTAYSLTNVSAALDFGTSDPTLVLDKAGTYLILARVNLRYNGATFAAPQAVTLKLRRTNNTPADLTGGTKTLTAAIVTTVTATFEDALLPPLFYTTANTNDIITLFGDVAVVPSAGSLDATEANIIAVRLTA